MTIILITVTANRRTLKHVGVILLRVDKGKRSFAGRHLTNNRRETIAAGESAGGPKRETRNISGAVTSVSYLIRDAPGGRDTVGLNLPVADIFAAE